MLILFICFYGLALAQAKQIETQAPPDAVQAAPGQGQLTPAFRSGGGAPLRVGVFVSPPFVMMDSRGEFSGMAIELWSTVAKELGLNYKYIRYHNFKELTAATVRGDVDVLVTNFTVTLERAEVMEISYPWFDSGMRVLVNVENKSSVFEELKDTGQLYAYIGLALLMFALTVGITLVRRRFDKKFHRGWKEGLAASFHDLILAAKSGRISHQYFGWIGYLLAALWMVAGVALIAYVTSTLTSAMTSVALTSNIHSLYDLPGKSVGTISGSVSNDFLLSRGIEAIAYDELEDGMEGLQRRRLDAFVDDAPVLEYYVYSHPGSGMDVVGNLFAPEKYAFAANKSRTKLMDAVSLQLIGLHESGELQRIKEKYFGPEDF